MRALELIEEIIEQADLPNWYHFKYMKKYNIVLWN